MSPDPAERDARLAAVLARLRQQGGRVTTARRAVLEALLDAEEHPTAEELADLVRRRHPDTHLSTVYRTLDAFEQIGVVLHVHLGHGRATYHLTDRRHHHAVCDVCGRVIELPESFLDEVTARLAAEHQFVAEAHHFALVGRCTGCR